MIFFLNKILFKKLNNPISKKINQLKINIAINFIDLKEKYKRYLDQTVHNVLKYFESHDYLAYRDS